jgi:Fe-S-cluster containining protein
MFRFFERRNKDEPAPGCHNCTSACCREGVIMELTDLEAAFLRAAGTEMYEREKEKRAVPSPYGDWQLLTDCAYLKTGDDGRTLCSIHKSPERPSICQFFEEGGWGCLRIRRKAGVDKKE